MKTITLIFLLLAFYTTVHAQSSHTVIGYIKDSRNEAIPGATVRLIHAKNSSIARSGISTEAGKFIFNEIQTGSYRILATASGQQQFISSAFSIDSLHNNIALPIIILLPAKKTAMAEVVITARRPLIVRDIDKTVVNVESMISSATSNTLEVLEKTPGITVSTNGDISLNGRSGVLVLIDGRSTYMSGQDLAAYLKSIPGGLLDKIELMDNPPAKYDASGNAVINIRLKKNRAGGFTGNISAGYNQGVYARSNNALNLNYKYKKINLFGNIGYSFDKNYNDDVYDRHFYNALHEQLSTISLVNKQQWKNKGINSFFGTDYSASANTTLGVLVNINENNRNGQLLYNSANYSTSFQPDRTGTGSTNGGDKRNNLGMNINLNHRFGNTGRELSADINYLRYTGNGNQVLQNNVYNAGGNPVSNSSFLYLLPSAITIYTAKADYSHPLSSTARMDAGFKSSVVDNDNTTGYFNTGSGIPVADNSQTNHFIYHENINAAYINGQAKWQRFGLQLGLRAENTLATGRQLGNDSVKESRFIKNYTQFFPSVFLSYKLDSAGSNSITASITRRINRPNYQSLNPFLFMRDQYTYTGGNPMLEPQYQYRYEIRFQHKQYLRMGLSYNRFSNVIFQTTDVVDNIFITKPENVAKGYMLLVNTGITVYPFKWWTLNSDILLSHMGLDGTSYGQKLNPNTYVARLNLFNMFQFKGGWSGEAGAYYASRDLNGQAFTSGMFRASAAIQKKIWKDKASIRLSF